MTGKLSSSRASILSWMDGIKRSSRSPSSMSGSEHVVDMVVLMLFHQKRDGMNVAEEGRSLEYHDQNVYLMKYGPSHRRLSEA